jgi:hypothetical protein
VPDRVANSFKGGLLAFALAALPSMAIAQSLHVEAGAGVGASTTSGHQELLHGYISGQKNLSDRFVVGLDLSASVNDDRVCEEAGCVLQFPNITGLAALAGLRMSELSFGIGPGLFYLHGSIPDHQYAGGIAAHADASLVHLRAAAVILSVRPLWVMGPVRSNGDRIIAVPITLGLRW